MSAKKVITKVELRKIEKGNLRAVGHMIIGDEYIRVNCTVVEGKDGLFMSLPRYKGSDDKWYFSTFFINEDLRTEAQAAVLDAYKDLCGDGASAPPPANENADGDGCPF